MATRVESDSMGTINVPDDKYYGAQTARSLANFDIGGEKMPAEIIEAFGILKKAAAQANFKLGLLPADLKDLIVAAADVEIGEAPGRLRPVVLVGRHIDGAHGIGFDARSHLAPPRVSRNNNGQPREGTGRRKISRCNARELSSSWAREPAGRDTCRT